MKLYLSAALLALLPLAAMAQTSATNNFQGPSTIFLMPGTMGVDFSANPATLLGLLRTVPPNPYRTNFWWQNQCGTAIQIVLDHDTSGTNYTVILAAPGGATGTQGYSDSLTTMGIRHLGQIRVMGATGCQVSTAEY